MSGFIELFLLVVFGNGSFVIAALQGNQRIVGGTLTTVNVYPEVAALLYSGGTTGFRQICGGTIINNLSILTAANCTHMTLPSRWLSRVGSSLANSGGVLRATAAILNHPDYNWRNDDSDIAIIRAATSVAYSSTIRPGIFAGSNQNIGDNTLLYAIGWGATNFGGPHSEQLRQSLIWTTNHFICRERYSELNRPVTENMLCSGYLDVGGRGQCIGDAGSPVMTSSRAIVGVYSFSEQCGLARYPNVNTRVSNFANWIQENA